MVPELTLIVVVFVAGVVMGMAAGTIIEQILSQKRRDAWRSRNRWRWKERNGNGITSSPWSPKPDPKVPDAADQLRIVMGATFTILKPLLNKKEARVFKELDRIVISRNPAWQVMAQVSLGEILRSKDTQAYSCYQLETGRPTTASRKAERQRLQRGHGHATMPAVRRSHRGRPRGAHMGESARGHGNGRAGSAATHVGQAAFPRPQRLKAASS